MALIPDINGNRTSWASIVLGVAAKPLIGIKSINYKDVGEIPKVKGTAGNPIGRTRGSNDCEGDVEILQQEWNELLPMLTAGGALGYSELSWPITVSYAEPSNLLLTVTDRLVGVRFFGAEKSNGEGTDALTVKVNLSLMRIVWNNRYVALRF